MPARLILFLSLVWFCNLPTPALAQTNAVERGAVLFSELGCANCHGQSPVKIPRLGPSLNDLAFRVERDWVAAVLDPATSSASTSPATNAFRHAVADPNEREDLLHWIATLKVRTKIKVNRHATAERGKRLFQETGCVACHDPELSLSHKTKLNELAHTLRYTRYYFPDGRMPHPSQTATEGQDLLDIAAHLVRFTESDPRAAVRIKKWPAPDPQAAQRGRVLAKKQGCLNCHQNKNASPPPLQPITSFEPAAGCLSPGSSRYHLDAEHRAALTAYLASDTRGADPSGIRTLTAVGCLNCHQRDGIGGPSAEILPFFTGHESLGDSGKLPPPLTGIGHKLQTNWFARVLAGDPETRMRPYLKTRMPAYPDHAETLVRWLAELDMPRDPPSLAKAGEEDIGRVLLGNQGGANCITCHVFNEHASLGIPALDLGSTAQRLQPTWFRQYMLKPNGYRPGTLMPALWPGGPDARSAWPQADGNTERQLSAIWSYLAKPNGLPPGLNADAAGVHEIVPTDRPVIQRTFFKGVGTHAIAVGFPDGIHLAYDGKHCAPAVLWKGRFIDAYGTWFSRFAPFTEPIGDQQVLIPRPEPDPARPVQFLGYTTAKDGTPTFLSRQGDTKIEETISIRGTTIDRRLTWTGKSPPVVRHPELPREAVPSAKPTTNALHWRYQWK